MSNALSGGGALPAAGWYPDPAGSGQERWWGGIAWSDDLRPTPLPPAPEPLTTNPFATNPFAAEQTATPSYAANPFAGETPVADPGYTPMGGWATAAATPWAEYSNTYHGSPNNVPIWLLALYPFWVFPLTFVLVSLLPVDTMTLSVVAGLAFLVIFVGLVLWDHAILRARNLQAASPLWFLLGLLVYLIARTVVLRSGGSKHDAPPIVLVLMVIVPGILSAIAIPILIAQSSSNQELANIEQYAEEALAEGTSETWEVTCPADAPVDMTAFAFECTGVSASGRTVRIAVTPQADGSFQLEEAP